MIPPVSIQALGATPAARAAQLVLALAAAPYFKCSLGTATTDRASQILADLLNAAMAGGFNDFDILLHLAAGRRFNGLIEQLAADVVARIGGPDKFFALLDLSSTPTDWIGFEQ